MSDPAPDVCVTPPPLISVIVRSMGRPSLAAALASIAAQQQSPVEVLLVNALGPGHGPPPAAAGAHPLRWIDLGRALPRSAAANAGLDAASGPWVIFLDDDDVFLPGHLSRLAAALSVHRDAVAAYADVEYGRQGAAGWASEHVFAADFDPLRLRFENFLPLHAVLVDRGAEAVRRCRFDEQIDLFEDWDWWLQLTRLGPFVRVPGVSARYVAADGGGSGVFSDNLAASRAREHLLLKWLATDTPAERLRLLLALQTHFRTAHQTADLLALAQRTEQDLRSMLAARVREVAEACAELDGLRCVVAAREREIADFDAQLAEVRQVLASREQEIVDANAQIGDLRQVLAARERELADNLAHSQGLARILVARDDEITHLKAQSSTQRGKPAARRPTDETP